MFFCLSYRNRVPNWQLVRNTSLALQPKSRPEKSPCTMRERELTRILSLIRVHSCPFAGDISDNSTVGFDYLAVNPGAIGSGKERDCIGNVLGLP
jgi:hypothetical protein